MSGDNTNDMIEKLVYIGVFGSLGLIMCVIGYILFR